MVSALERFADVDEFLCRTKQRACFDELYAKFRTYLDRSMQMTVCHRYCNLPTFNLFYISMFSEDEERKQEAIAFFKFLDVALTTFYYVVETSLQQGVQPSWADVADMFPNIRDYWK